MKSRRFIFVVLLAVLVAAAIAAGTATSSTSPIAAAPGGTNAVLAQSDTVWFCPGLPPALPSRSARVTFANIGAGPADVVVTDLADKGTATQQSFRVPSNTVVTKNRDQLGAPGALTVETFGGRILVEEGIEGVRALESTPCATRSAAHWYFGAGSTPRGVQQWLVIDNPYASDAKVNVTLRTSTGVLRPDALQGMDVMRRSRSVIPIHESAVRKDRVAVEVSVDLGSVVAAQTLVYSAVVGTPGVALSLGVPAAGTEWTFAGATAQPNSSAWVAIANVGADDAQVEVQATAESSKTTVLAPASVTVAQDNVVWVRLGQCAGATEKACIAIPNGVRYGLNVRSDQNLEIVAQTLGRLDNAPDVVGTITSPGAIDPAREWAYARSRVRGERSTSVALFNPSAGPAVVDIGLVHGGRIDHPRALQKITVPPGRSVTAVVVGGSKPSQTDAALMIVADQPIFVERSITAVGEAATAVGVVVG